MNVTLTLQDHEAEVLLGAIQPLVAALPRKPAPLRAAFLKLYDAVVQQAKPYVMSEATHATYKAAQQHTP